MSDDDIVFELTPQFALTPEVSTPPASPTDGQGPVSRRTLAQRRRAHARLTSMHARHGRGPVGSTCVGCVFLRRARHGVRAFLKCQRYGITRSEASDWRARWPACGAFHPTKTLKETL